MNRPLLILGAGGHSRVVVSVALQEGRWELVGVLDQSPKFIGERILSTSVVGTLDDLAAHHARGVRHVAIAVGDNRNRARLFELVRGMGFEVPTLCHATAHVEPSAQISREGALICARAVVGVYVEIGANTIINTNALIDHEGQIGTHAHIAPSSCLAGRVKVGEGTMIGANATVRNNTSVGAWSLVGAGSVVVSNIPDGVVAFGVPARVQRKLETAH